jgi:hypothetical protein
MSCGDRESSVTTCEDIATTDGERRLRRFTVHGPASKTHPTSVLDETSVSARATIVLRRPGAGLPRGRHVDVGYGLHEAYPEYALWLERLTTTQVRSAP